MLTVLHLSPHPDDEVLGAGATLLGLREAGHRVINLACSLGRPEQQDRRRAEVTDACRRAGKPWGIVPRGPEYAARMLGWGCRMFVLGFDIHAFHAGIRATKQRYAAFYEATE